MYTIKIKVKPDAEDVLTNSLMGRGQFGLQDEKWSEDEGLLTVLMMDGDDTTAAIEQGLNTNDDIIEWWTE